MLDKNYYVYILANKTNSVVYVGVTNDLLRRLYEHRYRYHQGFAERYNADKLVYYEHTNDIVSALDREKQLKKWSRAKKNKLIEEFNKDWKDLSEGWTL